MNKNITGKINPDDVVGKAMHDATKDPAWVELLTELIPDGTKILEDGAIEKIDEYLKTKK